MASELEVDDLDCRLKQQKEQAIAATLQLLDSRLAMSRLNRVTKNVARQKILDTVPRAAQYLGYRINTGAVVSPLGSDAVTLKPVSNGLITPGKNVKVNLNGGAVDWMPTVKSFTEEILPFIEIILDLVGGEAKATDFSVEIYLLASQREIEDFEDLKPRQRFVTRESRFDEFHDYLVRYQDVRLRISNGQNQGIGRVSAKPLRYFVEIVTNISQRTLITSPNYEDEENSNPPSYFLVFSSAAYPVFPSKKAYICVAHPEAIPGTRMYLPAYKLGSPPVEVSLRSIFISKTTREFLADNYTRTKCSTLGLKERMLRLCQSSIGWVLVAYVPAIEGDLSKNLSSPVFDYRNLTFLNFLAIGGIDEEGKLYFSNEHKRPNVKDLTSGDAKNYSFIPDELKLLSYRGEPLIVELHTFCMPPYENDDYYYDYSEEEDNEEFLKYRKDMSPIVFFSKKLDK